MKTAKNDEFAFYPLKTRASLLRPPETTKMTKMAVVTQAKAWFRKKTGLLFPEKGGKTGDGPEALLFHTDSLHRKAV